MKKILALLLCIILVCTLSVTAFATETDETPVEVTETEKTGDDVVNSIVSWVKRHFEELSVIATLLLTIFYNVKKYAKMNKLMGTLNNNAITVANNSSNAINAAANTVSGYVNEFADLKKTITTYVEQTSKYLETAKLANMELANEVAELLVLANIPPSKKEELYARHRAAVDAIASAEKATEVMGNVEEA